jgi:uncharacterized protein
MSDDEFDLRAFSGRVPLFPLPNVVLFPGAVLPLRIFEPRYRRMLRDALANERLIGMALLRPGWEADYQGRPPIFEVAGVGRIAKAERLATGTFNVVLEGLFRGRIEQEESRTELPYRVARIAPLVDDPGAEEERDRRKLVTAFERFDAVRLGTQKRPELDLEQPLGALAFRIAALSDVEALGKQQVLEAPDPLARARVVARLLESRARALGLLRRRLVIPRDTSWN